MNKNNPANQLIKEIASISKDAKKSLALRNSLEEKLKKSQKLGIVYGSLYKRDEKYVYLLHRSKVGEKRRREYLGVDEKVIAHYEACIERSKEYDEVQKSLNSLDSRLQNALHYLKLARFTA